MTYQLRTTKAGNGGPGLEPRSSGSWPTTPKGRTHISGRNSGDYSTESGPFLLAQKSQGLAHLPRDRDLGRSLKSGFLKALSYQEKPY